MKIMLKNYFNTNQARILTALILTGILSVASGSTLIKGATASANFSLETSNEVLKDNIKPNRLPRPVANAVLRDLTRRQGILTRELQIIDYNQQTWRNGCLELPQPDELCTQALVPGWLVVVSNGKENWIYHTNQTGSAVRLNEKANESTLAPVQIPVSELPPPLDRDVVFRQISSGGFAGRTYQTVLLKDGRLIRVRIGDANDSERTVRRVSVQQVQQFQRFLERSKFSKFQNLSYPAPSGSADFITFTLTSQEGTVQYNDISQNNLPKNLQAAVKAWNQIAVRAQ
ncbi:MAG: hypothetical protein HWQ41_08070 [Nostoc sp. NOS(2021)]|uniref:hypothetical protein n=1 Tax=Nostoc sp. NOS(2021) TaxID=2815407 RepID=UPI0025E1B867|nr:hypothetical protein [Nostoc sp. NOS(2021)]MBN3895211.1 hypothetical protein [Nostoc sp. NOS(2021)]